MKILSKSISYLLNIERYDLDDVFTQLTSSSGLIISYVLATSKSSKLISLELIAKHEEIGVIEKWYNRFCQESFANTFHGLKDFLEAYDYNDFGMWIAKVLYKGVEVTISGDRDNTELGVSYPKEIKLNLLPLLSEVESSTYQYNDYDKSVLNMLKTKYNLSEKRAVLTIQKLLKHKDIYDEFVSVSMSGNYTDEASAVSAEGYTAQALESNYPLSLLGAYNYLIYLRESPEEAIDDLKKGLPRR